VTAEEKAKQNSEELERLIKEYAKQCGLEASVTWKEIPSRRRGVRQATVALSDGTQSTLAFPKIGWSIGIPKLSELDSDEFWADYDELLPDQANQAREWAREIKQNLCSGEKGKIGFK